MWQKVWAKLYHPFECGLNKKYCNYKMQKPGIDTFLTELGRYSNYTIPSITTTPQNGKLQENFYKYLGFALVQIINNNNGPELLSITQSKPYNFVSLVDKIIQRFISFNSETLSKENKTLQNEKQELEKQKLESEKQKQELESKNNTLESEKQKLQEILDTTNKKIKSLESALTLNKSPVTINMLNETQEITNVGKLFEWLTPVVKITHITNNQPAIITEFPLTTYKNNKFSYYVTSTKETPNIFGDQVYQIELRNKQLLVIKIHEGVQGGSRLTHKSNRKHMSLRRV
jgi:hypothetical protein